MFAMIEAFPRVFPARGHTGRTDGRTGTRCNLAYYNGHTMHRLPYTARNCNTS